MKTFFTNPGTDKELKNSLINDFKNAKERILIAIGFLNDADIVSAIRNNMNVKEKRVILNEVDIQQAIAYAKKKEKEKKEKEKEHKEKNEEDSLSKILSGIEEELKEELLPINQKWLDDKLYVVSLGRADSDLKQSNLMHHKFAIVDNQLWVGTYNFTYGASNRNWEYMIRFPNEEQYAELLIEFEDQFYRLFRLGIFFNENRNSIVGKMCSNCNKPIFDSNKHFLLQEKRYIDYTVGYNYSSNSPTVSPLETTSTEYKIECKNKHKDITLQTRNCSSCGVKCNQFDITEIIEKIQFIDDGSVEFRDGYNEIDHQDSEEITYKCPKCFVKGTMRSRYKNWWAGGIVPDYL